MAVKVPALIVILLSHLIFSASWDVVSCDRQTLVATMAAPAGAQGPSGFNVSWFHTFTNASQDRNPAMTASWFAATGGFRGICSFPDGRSAWTLPTTCQIVVMDAAQSHLSVVDSQAGCRPSYAYPFALSIACLPESVVLLLNGASSYSLVEVDINGVRPSRFFYNFSGAYNLAAFSVSAGIDPSDVVLMIQNSTTILLNVINTLGRIPNRLLYASSRLVSSSPVLSLDGQYYFLEHSTNSQSSLSLAACSPPQGDAEGCASITRQPMDSPALSLQSPVPHALAILMQKKSSSSSSSLCIWDVNLASWTRCSPSGFPSDLLHATCVGQIPGCALLVATTKRGLLSTRPVLGSQLDDDAWLTYKIRYPSTAPSMQDSSSDSCQIYSSFGDSILTKPIVDPLSTFDQFYRSDSASFDGVVLDPAGSADLFAAETDLLSFARRIRRITDPSTSSVCYERSQSSTFRIQGDMIYYVAYRGNSKPELRSYNRHTQVIETLLLLPPSSSSYTDIAVDDDLAFLGSYSGLLQCSLSNLTCTTLVYLSSSNSVQMSIALMPEQRIVYASYLFGIQDLSIICIPYGTVVLSSNVAAFRILDLSLSFFQYSLQLNNVGHSALVIRNANDIRYLNISGRNVTSTTLLPVNAWGFDATKIITVPGSSAAFVWSRWQISRFSSDTTLGLPNPYTDFEIFVDYPTQPSGPTITAVAVDPTANTLYWVMTAVQSQPGPVSLFSLPLDAVPGQQPDVIWENLPAKASGFSANAFGGFAVSTQAKLIATPYPQTYSSQNSLAFWNLTDAAFLGYLFEHPDFQQNFSSTVGSLQTGPDGNFYFTGSFYDQTQFKTRSVGNRLPPVYPPQLVPPLFNTTNFNSVSTLAFGSALRAWLIASSYDASYLLLTDAYQLDVPNNAILQSILVDFSPPSNISSRWPPALSIPADDAVTALFLERPYSSSGFSNEQVSACVVTASQCKGGLFPLLISPVTVQTSTVDAQTGMIFWQAAGLPGYFSALTVSSVANWKRIQTPLKQVPDQRVPKLLPGDASPIAIASIFGANNGRLYFGYSEVWSIFDVDGSDLTAEIPLLSLAPSSAAGLRSFVDEKGRTALLYASGSRIVRMAFDDAKCSSYSIDTSYSIPNPQIPLSLSPILSDGSVYFVTGSSFLYRTNSQETKLLSWTSSMQSHISYQNIGFSPDESVLYLACLRFLPVGNGASQNSYLIYSMDPSGSVLQSRSLGSSGSIPLSSNPNIYFHFVSGENDFSKC